VVKKKIGVCPYCGREKNLTQEHVIPQTLFRELDQNMVTVPICHQCNNGMSAAVRDLRNLIVLSMQDSSHPDTEYHLRKIVDSNEATRRWLERTTAEAEEFDYVDDEGNLLGRGFLREFDKARARMALAQVVRGLYHVETGTSLPPETQVAGMDIPGPYAPTLIANLTGFNHDEPQSRGDRVVTWVPFLTIEGGGPTDTAWLLIFLDGACFVAGTGIIGDKIEEMWQHQLQAERNGSRVNGRLQVRAARLPDGRYYVPPQ
jgi:hypothetical protein